jgi:hypothetical protein
LDSCEDINEQTLKIFRDFFENHFVIE